MIGIEALKKNWQNQKPAINEKLKIEKIIGGSLSRLKKFEKKQFRINMFKTAGIAILFTYLTWVMLVATSFSIIKLIAIAWLIVSAIIFLKTYWKVQLRVNKLNVRGNSLEFIDDVLDNFSTQRELFREKFWMFGLALIIGINILYLDILKNLHLLERLGYHLLFSIIMIAVIWGGIKIRMFRFKREYEPIENELIKIKEDLSELFTA